jgi:tetratricopeptide (TPR) repeat protein
MAHSLTLIDKLVIQGYDYHQKGMLNEAKALYEQALKVQSKNFSALQLIATLYAQNNEPLKAIDFFSKAIRINPNFGPCYSNRGNALKEIGRYNEALINYDKAISLQPSDANNYSNRGVALQELGRLEEALSSYDKAISLDPNSAEAFSNRGVALQELGRLEEALSSYDIAIKLKDNFSRAYANRADVLQKLSRFNEALSDYDEAIRLEPNNAEVYFNCGNAFKELGRFKEALDCYQSAISFNPKWPEAYCNQGSALQALRQLDTALVSFNMAIDLKPDYAEAYSNRGNALQEMGRLEESLESYDKAIQIAPRLVDAYSNRGLVLEKLKHLSAAIASFDAAIQLDPNLADVRFNKSLTLLLSGNFEKGWQEYEWRWKKHSLIISKQDRFFSKPAWLGDQPLNDKKIYLYSEQGMGDTIQFCRYAPIISNLGAEVILEVQPPLVQLLKQMPGVSDVVRFGDAVPPMIDFHCPLMSLPLALKTTLDTIPKNTPYLKADSTKFFYWQKKLSNVNGFRVGLVWNGGFRPDQIKLWGINDRRNIPVSKLSKALSDLNVNFYSLQKGDPAESEIKLLEHELWPNENFFNYSNELHDFSDTAALIANLDLIISVDTSTAHLAAAMGKPVWLMNRYDSCWRWFLDRDDSPWYPSLKIYRQSRMNDWDDILERVKTDLEKLNSNL